MFSAEMEAVAWPAHYKRQAASRQSSGNGSALQNGGGTGGTPQKDKSQHEPAEAQAAFCFAVSDGRLGSITVTDRGVKKRPVTAPHWTVQYVDRLVVTSIAAMGDLVFIGDSEGVLYQWNTVSGQTMVVPAARKVIRKISVGPPVPASLRSGAGVGAGLARLVLLYGDGTLGVCFDLPRAPPHAHMPVLSVESMEIFTSESSGELCVEASLELCILSLSPLAVEEHNKRMPEHRQQKHFSHS